MSRLDRINDVGRPLNNIGGAVIENKIGTIITTISAARTTTITTTLTKTTTTKTLSNWGNIGGSLPVSHSTAPELGSKSDTVPVPASTSASTSASASVSVSLPFLNKQETSNSVPLSRHYVQDSNCSCTCSHIGTAVKSAIRTINCSSISEHRQKEEEIERQEQQEQEQRVRVHIGIDEDLRMILDMDPSIVDGMPTSSLVHANSRNNGHVAFARPLRSTRPQGWYRIIKTVRDLTDSRFFIFNFLSLTNLSLNQLFNFIIYIYIFFSFFSFIFFAHSIYIYIIFHRYTYCFFTLLYIIMQTNEIFLVKLSFSFNESLKYVSVSVYRHIYLLLDRKHCI